MVLLLAALAFVAFSAVTTSKQNPKDGLKLEVKGRKTARMRAKRGIDMLLTEDYVSALTELDRAIRSDPDFSEAYLARSVTQLGVGKPTAAIADANSAKALLEKHSLDEIAWQQHPKATVNDGRLIADRVICIAKEVGKTPLSLNEGALLVRLFREFTMATDCVSSQSTMERWKHEGRVFRIVDHARSQCAQLWTNCSSVDSESPLVEEPSPPTTPEKESQQ